MGRPVVTTPGEIEQAAFRLFAAAGFEGTTMAAIAAEVGVGQRTLFRYYPSKNDIPWGQFDQTLDSFRQILDGTPEDVSLIDAIQQAVLRFNEYDPDAQPPHRDRMRLILRTPALQAHSVLRYADWRAVIATYVARRRGLAVDDLFPQTVAQVSLSLALTAYDAWLDHPETSLAALLDDAMGCLRDYVTAD
ncbi:Transcriptional regulator, TetR family [Nocardioides sp. PD653]|nr:Transcriptional regulator, TetR family [Nocardioides sp. PD653-B2]GAW56284.1 Transcriptional regulator, TetR family [Nocardioides sp. PD653]